MILDEVKGEKCNVDPVHTMKAYGGEGGGAEVQLCSFSSSALDGGECQHHALTALSPGKNSGND
jgi:hypothetical protein